MILPPLFSPSPTSSDPVLLHACRIRKSRFDLAMLLFLSVRLLPPHQYHELGCPALDPVPSLKYSKNVEEFTKSMKMIASSKFAGVGEAYGGANDSEGADSHPRPDSLLTSSNKRLRQWSVDGTDRLRGLSSRWFSFSVLLDLASSSPPSTKSAVDTPTFADAITNLIIQKNAKYESVALVSKNNFICGLSYEPTVMEVKGEEICKERNVVKGRTYEQSARCVGDLQGEHTDVFEVYKNEDEETKDFVELQSTPFTLLSLRVPLSRVLVAMHQRRNNPKTIEEQH
ncbi:hypothetical protein BJ912DRAFT_1054765 [Pholiota molesta]|nr:hypothetical protein BJ912DRAFT_1054765 [Pholiota molesta]